MKFTKILILLLGITVMFSCKSKEKVTEVASQPQVEQTEGRRGARGQRPGGERGNRGDFQARQAEQQAKLFADLGLSDAQKTKMESIQKGTRDKMQAMRADMRDGNTDRMVMREKMESIRKAEAQEVKKIMTEEQFAKYEKFLKERQGQRGQRGGRGGRGGN